MKRTIILIFLITMLITVIPFSAFAAEENEENITHTINAVNSYREADTMVIYNQVGTTGSNPWGYEVTVNSSGRVVSVGGNNNYVPKGGFVVSGHGVSATFLKENVKVGDKIVFLEEQMIISIGENEPSPFYSLTMPYNGINIYRDENFTVIYTPNSSTTQTNSYGYEVTVENGVVTVCGGNNSPIPKNGYVISCHGTAKTVLSGIATIGMDVTYDTKSKTITFRYGETSLIYSDKAKLENAEETLKTAKDNCYVIDVSAMENAVEEARTLFNTLSEEYSRSGDIEPYLSARKQLLTLLEAIQIGTCESRPVEYRAVWIEPTERTVAQVQKTVQSAYDQGINTICLETLFSSTMIYPTPDGSLFSQNPSLRGFDLLQAYIDECHAHGMELHVWMPVFYVGNEGGTNAHLSVFNLKPEWQCIDNNGGTGDDTTYTLNPASREACDFLLETYRYILETYDIDGFQLDYIRYPHNGNVDYGYDDATLAAFKEKYGVTPTYSPNADYWNDWCNFRCDYVTDFVRRVRELIDEVAPNVLLSADLYGDAAVASRAVYQDATRWINEGLIDIAFPMTYDETTAFAIKADKYISLDSDTVLTVCGLGSFVGSNTSVSMLEQVKVLQELTKDGCCFFEFTSYTSKSVYDKLQLSAYSQDALAPFYDIYKSVTTYCEYISTRINDIMQPKAIITASEAADLTNLLSAISSGSLTAESMKSLTDAINAVADDTAREILQRDLSFIAKLIRHYDWSGPRQEASDPGEEESDEAVDEKSQDESEVGNDSSDVVTTPTSDNILPWIIIGGAIVAAATVITIIAVKKKKSK